MASMAQQALLVGRGQLASSEAVAKVLQSIDKRIQALEKKSHGQVIAAAAAPIMTRSAQLLGIFNIK